MLLKTIRFVSLLCAALTLGLTVTHDLEIPGKQMLSGAEWLSVQQTFYGGFAIVGGIAEVLGLISTGVLLSLLRKRRTAFLLTLVAAISFVGMLTLFAFGNNPLNQQIMAWTPQALPANWQQTRCLGWLPRSQFRLRCSGTGCITRRYAARYTIVVCANKRSITRTKV